MDIRYALLFIAVAYLIGASWNALLLFVDANNSSHERECRALERPHIIEQKYTSRQEQRIERICARPWVALICSDYYDKDDLTVEGRIIAMFCCEEE